MDCYFYNLREKKCMNVNNVNCNGYCDNNAEHECFVPYLQEEPCFWSDESGMCTYLTSSYFNYPCHGCGKYKPPEEIPSDQTAKADAGKLELTLVPRQIIREIAKVRMYGKQKYKDPDIWKNISPERLRNAAYRHFLSYLDDPSGVDEESGISHLSHLATNIAFLIELENNHED